MKCGATAFLLFVAPCALHAATMTFSSCTAATTMISPCPAEGLVGAGYIASASAAASDNSIPPPFAGAFPSISAEQAMSASASVITFATTPIQLSPAAQASASMTYYSGGVPRSGFINFAIVFGGDSVGNIMFTDGVHQYNYDVAGGVAAGSTPPIGSPTSCGFGICEFAATLPFDLGSTFDVFTSAQAQRTASGPATGQPNSGVDSGIAFGLLEGDGTTPAAVFPTPEPSSWALGLLGLGVFGLLGSIECCRGKRPQH